MLPAGRPGKLPRMAGALDVAQASAEALLRPQPLQSTGAGQAGPGGSRRRSKRAARPSSWQRRRAARLRETAAMQDSGDAPLLRD